MPITVRIETDAVSATDAMGKSAEAFTHDTGIQVVVEKYGYKSSMEKATEDGYPLAANTMLPALSPHIAVLRKKSCPCCWENRGV
jgi:hypothetical protein